MRVIVEAQQMTAGSLCPRPERLGLGAGHVGFETAEPGKAGRARDPRRRVDQAGKALARAAVMAGAVELAGEGGVGHCRERRSSFPATSYIQQRCPRVQPF